jgi:hypothetical protein
MFLAILCACDALSLRWTQCDDTYNNRRMKKWTIMLCVQSFKMLYVFVSLIYCFR